jgi:hypothetical protein
MFTIGPPAGSAAAGDEDALAREIVHLPLLTWCQCSGE